MLKLYKIGVKEKQKKINQRMDVINSEKILTNFKINSQNN